MSDPRDRGLLACALYPAPHPELPPAGAAARICIVTLEVNGPSHNGGIGTAYTTLAEKLAGRGHEVTLLYLLGRHSEGKSFDHWVEHFRRRGVRLVPLEPGDVILDGSRSLQLSYLAYRWLSRQEQQGNAFDVIHFHEWLGFGWFSLLARAQGLALTRTTICVGLHSPTMWIYEANRMSIDALDVLECDALERGCVDLADVVWSPSRYLLDWCDVRGWAIDERAWVHPNPAPRKKGTDLLLMKKGSDPFFIFFGRLEVRKGLVLFCDALDRLDHAALPGGFRVCFLGKACSVDGIDAVTYVRRRAERWTFPVELRTELGHEEAIQHLRQQGALAVMPSLIDNCPMTVIECVSLGIPFLASAVGGIPELVHPDCHETNLFQPDADELAGRLKQALAHGVPAARPAVDAESCDRTWDAWHRQQAGVRKCEPTVRRDEYELLLEPGTRPVDGAREQLEWVAERTGADIVTTFEDVDEGDGVVRRLYAGIDSPVGVARNCYGGSALVRRSVLDRLDHSTPGWAFHARAVLSGLRLTVVPEPLFLTNRRHDDPTAVLPLFLEDVPADYRDLVRLAQGQALRLQQGEPPAAPRPLRYRIADILHNGIARLPLARRALRGLLGALMGRGA